MKKTRRIYTFEPEPEVEAMCERAKEVGLTLRDILNKAMRCYGKRVIKSLADKQRKDLSALSFNVPSRQSDGEFDLAA